jgi:hypothetical protein
MLGLGRLAGLVASWALLYGLFAWLYRRRTLRRDWHRDVLAVGVLVLGVLAFYWPLFFTESWIPKGGGDLSSFIYPIYVFAARWLKRGVIPLWNPHLYLGMPFAADNQSGLFYPINLLFFLIAPELTYETVELMAVTHVFLAGLFTYLFLRDLPSPRLFPGRASLSLSGAQPPHRANGCCGRGNGLHVQRSVCHPSGQPEHYRHGDLAAAGLALFLPGDGSTELGLGGV